MWFIIGIIVFILLLLKNSKEGFDLSTLSEYPPSTKTSLYGYDDYSPDYRYLWEQEQQNPYHKLKENEWQVTKDRRRNGKNYIQMPSYNHVRQSGYSK